MDKQKLKKIIKEEILKLLSEEKKHAMYNPESGEKIIQLVLVPVFYDDIEVVDENVLFKTQSERGTGGFGSTGVV